MDCASIIKIILAKKYEVIGAEEMIVPTCERSYELEITSHRFYLDYPIISSKVISCRTNLLD